MAGPIRILHLEPSQHYDSSTSATRISKNRDSNHTPKTKIPPLKDDCSQLLIATEPSKMLHKTSGAEADPVIEDAIEQSTSEDPQLAQSDGSNRRPSIKESSPSSSDIYRIQWPVKGSKRQKKIYPLAPLGSDGWSEAQYQERVALVIGHLKKAVDDHPELRDYVRHIDYAPYMCGTTPSTAVSSIVVYCPQTLVPQLRICFNKKAMERVYCGRRSSFYNLFKKTDPARPPFRLVYFRTSGTPTTRKAAETDICGHIKSDTTMCGTLVKHGGHTATLALTLSVDSQYLGLTVNHLFRKSCNLEDLKYSHSSVLSHSESVADECEEWTINDDDLASVDQLWVDDMDYDDSEECKWPSLDSTGMAHESGSDHRHAATNDLLPWVSVGRKVDLLEEPAPSEPDLDWSLVKLPVQYASRPNAFYPNGEGYSPRYLTTCANTPRYHGVPVFMISGASGLRNGLLLGNYSYIGAKAGQGHCKVWTVILDDPIGVIEGDCGSVIVDQQTSEVYGHVVGANPLDQAYVVPISATTEQIRKSLQATEVTIPQPPHPLHESHFQEPHTTTFNGEEPEELRDFWKLADEASVPGICGMGGVAEMVEIGAVASAFTIVVVAYRLSRYVSWIANEARDIKETSGTISKKVVRWDEVLRAVHSSLKGRKKQIRFKPLSEDEEQIWLAVGNALERCQQTMKKFEKEIERLGDREKYGWLRRGLIAMNSIEDEPKTIRLEKDMKADIASLSVLLPCFQPFEHEERLTLLRAGNAITNRYLPSIVEAIEKGEIRLGKLSQQNIPQGTVHKEHKHDRDDSSATQTVIGRGERYTHESLDLRTMKECLGAAVSFRDKLLRAGSVIGQSRGDMSQQDGSSGVRYDLSQGVVGERSNTESETDSSDESDGGGIPLYTPSPPNHAWTRHEVMGSTGNTRESTEHFPHNRDDTVPPEAIMNALIDSFKDNARNDFVNERYYSAERHLLDAIEYGKKRLEIYNFPFDEIVELREQLAEAYAKQEKFSEAEQEYLCLIGESRKSSGRYGRLCCALATAYQKKYYAGNEKDCKLFEVWEDYSMRSLHVALDSPREGNTLLQRSAKLLVDLYEKQNKPAFAKPYRELYLTTPRATYPPVHSISPTSFVSNSTHPVSPVPSSFSSDPSTRFTSVNLVSVIDEEDMEKIGKCLQNGEDIEKLSATERLLLTNALAHNQAGITRNPNTYTRLTGSGEPALHHAARKGDLDMVQVLLGLRLRRPVDQTDQKEATPLLVAARWNRNSVVQCLLESGAHVGAQDKSGWTVLHHAIFGQGENVAMLQHLLDKHADVNATNNENETPLHFAVKSPYNKQRSAEILLRNSASIEAKNKANKTPLWLAVNGRKHDMVELLLRNGATFGNEEPLPETSQEISGLLKEEMKRRGISRRISGNTTASKRSIWQPLSRLRQDWRSS